MQNVKSPHRVGYFINDQLVYLFTPDTKPTLQDYLAFDSVVSNHEDPSISGNFEIMTREYYTE